MNYVGGGGGGGKYQELIAIFYLIKISINIFCSEESKVSFGFKYIFRTEHKGTVLFHFSMSVVVRHPLSTIPFKNQLFLYHWANFNQTSQEYFLGDSL